MQVLTKTGMIVVKGVNIKVNYTSHIATKNRLDALLLLCTLETGKLEIQFMVSEAALWISTLLNE